MFVFLAIVGCRSDTFPDYQRGIDFFESNHEKLQRVADYMAVNAGIEEIFLCPEGNWGIKTDESDCMELADQDIRLLMEQLNVGFVMRTNEESILFDGGADAKAGRSWAVSFVYFPKGNVDRSECSQDGPQVPIGVCDFEIANSWSLRYEWYPEDLSESDLNEI